MRKPFLLVAATVFLVCLLLAVNLAHATFPGQNGRISFARFLSDTGSTSIFSTRPDSSGEQQLTFDAPNHFSAVTNWSPNGGSRIAFDSDRFSNAVDDFEDIFTMKADGSDVVQLTTHSGFNGEPEYSLDGNTIAFESDRGQGLAGEGIYLMNASDGTNVNRVTVAPAGFFDAFPHFSPAGNLIAFTRGNGCRPPNRGSGGPGCLLATFLVNLDGSELRRITPWGLNTSATDWSPDGRKLVLESTFNIQRGDKTDVLVVGVDGSNLVNLTNNPPLALGTGCSISNNAKFSPDGTKLVFRHTDCTGHPKLWIMNADGSGKQDTGIDLGRGSDGFPDWGTNQS